jgi:hypothetical protein
MKSKPHINGAREMYTFYYSTYDTDPTKKFYGKLEASTKEEAREIIRKENLPNQVNIELTLVPPTSEIQAQNHYVLFNHLEKPHEDQDTVNFGLDDDK